MSVGCVLCANYNCFVSLCFRVGDNLLSINDISLIGDTVAHAEAFINKLSRGPVRIVAMAPPRDITVQRTSPNLATPAYKIEKDVSISVSDSQPLLSPSSEEGGVITVQVSSSASSLIG